MNTRRIDHIKHLAWVVSRLKQGKRIALKIRRGRHTFHLSLPY